MGNPRVIGITIPVGVTIAKSRYYRDVTEPYLTFVF
jgi:hypothetical protein